MPFYEVFKDIRREWKAKKKEEEARKAAAAEDERQRQAAAAAQNGSADSQASVDAAQPATTYSAPGTVQLPPIGYQPARYTGPPTPGIPQQQMPEYNYNNYSPASPYGQSNQQMYTQRMFFCLLFFLSFWSVLRAHIADRIQTLVASPPATRTNSRFVASPCGIYSCLFSLFLHNSPFFCV